MDVKQPTTNSSSAFALPSSFSLLLKCAVGALLSDSQLVLVIVLFIHMSNIDFCYLFILFFVVVFQIFYCFFICLFCVLML